MTTATLTNQPGARAASTSIAMGRLVEVELRKMVNTRASRWLLAGILGIVAIALGVVALQASTTEQRSFGYLAQLAIFVVAFFLPVLGILAATTEWTQRTVLGTFSLVPQRARILTAKGLSALVLAVVATVATLVLTGLATALMALATSGAVDWSVSVGTVAGLFLFSALSMMLGLALGTALLNSMLAIVLFFILPTLWGALVSMFSSMAEVQPWVDTTSSWNRLLEPTAITGTHWAQIVTTTLLWVALPISIGTWRVLRREVD